MIGEKYPFFDVPEDDVSPLFTTKLQEAAHVGCLRGVFDGNGTTTDWIRGNDALKSPAFDTELRDMVETLRRDGPLKNFQSMRQFCQEHPQARMSGRQTFYAFRIDTQRHRYHLRFFPQKRKFHIHFRLDFDGSGEFNMLLLPDVQKQFVQHLSLIHI